MSGRLPMLSGTRGVAKLLAIGVLIFHNGGWLAQRPLLRTADSSRSEPIAGRGVFIGWWVGKAEMLIEEARQIPPGVGNFAGYEEFFRELGIRAEAVLLLDYDGTLAPFQINRDQAIPYPGVRDVLSQIARHGRTRVVIVSGRPVADVSRLLALPIAVEIWGGHGRQRFRPGIGTDDAPVSPLFHSTLDTFRQWGHTHGLAERIEPKPGGVALHVRGLSAESAAHWIGVAEQAFSPRFASAGLVAHRFDGGIEWRDPRFTKARAIRTVLAELPSPPSSSSLSASVAFLGDDRTDEDGFVALEKNGLAVLVRPTPRPSHAHLWIVPPHELLGFLERWASVRG